MGGKDESNRNNNAKKISSCDVEALKKCLEENRGDQFKCQSQIEAFKSSCAVKKPSSAPELSSKPESVIKDNR